jgi:hypothetical protein
LNPGFTQQPAEKYTDYQSHQKINEFHPLDACKWLKIADFVHFSLFWSNGG